MKKIFISLLIINITLFSFAFDTSPFLKVSGSVKSYTKTDYSISQKFGNYFRTPNEKYKHVFNTTGQETESTEYTALDEFVDKVSYEYDSNNNLISQTAYDKNSKLEWKIVSTWNADGFKTEESEYDNNNTLKGKSIYSKEGNAIDETYYNGDGSLVWKIVTKYGSLNKKTEELRYSENGTLNEKLTYTYSEKGLLKEISYTDKDANQIQKEEYYYDDNDLLTEISTFNQYNEKSKRQFYKYDAKNNLIKTTTYNVTQKFGSVVNELTGMSEYTYEY